MKKTYFHGTSEDNLQSILRKGLLPDCQKVWNPSLSEVYLWSPDRLTEVGDCEAEWASDHAKQRAYESAQMAMTLAKSGKCVVLEIELNDTTVSDDDSCENMSGAVATAKVTRKQIKRIFISPDLSLLRGYFVGVALQNDLFNSYNFTETERTIGEVFQKAEIYPEIMDDFPLEEFVN